MVCASYLTSCQTTYLTRYEKASGATINMNKTTITQLANAKIFNLQNKLENFKIIKNKGLFKILGIYSSKDLQFSNV